VTFKFRKVGFAKCESGRLLPVIFLGPNDAPSCMRREWLKRLNQHLRQGFQMLHLVAFFGEEDENDKFALVSDVYVHDDALEEEFRRIPERVINRKIIRGEALSETDVKFIRGLLGLSVAKSLPEEYRWVWKTMAIS